MPLHDPAFLERAWATAAAAARSAQVAVVLGTERRVSQELRITAMVVQPDGTIAGWQDKVQLDPSEDGTFSPGTERQLFRVAP